MLLIAPMHQDFLYQQHLEQFFVRTQFELSQIFLLDHLVLEPDERQQFEMKLNKKLIVI